MRRTWTTLCFMFCSMTYCLSAEEPNAGFDVRVGLTADPQKIKGDAQVNYQIVKRMPIPIQPIPPIDAPVREADLLVDALLGTGFSGQVRSPLDGIIKTINDSGKLVVAVDVPSGLDCQTGRPSTPTVQADLTVTFVAVKAGMRTAEAAPYVGEVQTADIGVPRELIERIAAG